MSKENRLRCPVCGMCYEGDHAADNLQSMICQACGKTVKLQEEDPDGVVSGAFPPLYRLIALGIAILCSLLAVKYSFFAVLTFGALVYLGVEILRGHKKQRADRIAMWDRLREAYSILSTSYSQIAQESESTKKAYSELYNAYESISPELRGQLASEIANKQEALGVIGELTILRSEKASVEDTIKQLKKKVISLEQEELMQSFGFYPPMYDCVDCESYRKLLDKTRGQQKDMVKNKEAVRVESDFMSACDSKSAAKTASKNLEKMILRAFNVECDEIIDNVTFNNLDALTDRLRKSFGDTNDLCRVIGLSLSKDYLNLKIEELHICYEYQLKDKEEKEEQRRIREDMREKAKVLKEIEEAKKKIEKEKTHFAQIIDELTKRMEAAAIGEKAQYEAKLREYETQLEAVKKDEEEVLYREQSTRAGYVYIISNIGSFGENVYKIGVTRRLDPQERIEELGDASVPFKFDVHAVIFSDDAPALEDALHEHFADKAINKINTRKEFFRVSLGEIEEVVRTHHNKVVEFTRLAKAEDYRLSLAKNASTSVAVS